MKDKKVKKRGRRTKRKILLVILLILITFASMFAYRVHQNGGGWQGILMTLFGHNPRTVQDLEKIHVLVAGSDDGGLSDTIMLVSYDPQTQQVGMLSIPRDTFIGENRNRPRPADRINALADAQNPRRLMDAVEELVGIEISYYLFVEIDIIVELVDVIGGVWFDVPIDMRYDDYGDGLHINLTARISIYKWGPSRMVTEI